MIYCTLSVLLAERQLRISKVSADTGISRTTLTSLAFNYWQGVRSDTMNTLCKYLDVSVSDLFQFLPIDIKFSDCDYCSDDNTADITFKCDADDFSGDIHCLATIDIEEPTLPDKIHIACVSIEEYDAINAAMEQENKILETIFKQLPIPMVTSIKNEIGDALIKEISSKTSIDPDAWEFEIDLPSYWKRDKSHGND